MSLDKDTQVSLVYGTEYQYDAEAGITTTTSTTFQNKLTLVTTNLPLWEYELMVSYGWNHDAQNSDFEARVQLGAVNLWQIHKQEPKDSGGGDPTWTTQRIPTSRTFEPITLSWVNTFTLDYRTDNGGQESSIRDAYMKIIRVL